MIRTSAKRTGFTLIELMAVVVILAVLAGVALPKFFDYSATAKSSATKGILGGVRAGIANFYADKAINSAAADWPSHAELTALGTVMQGPIPQNPYTNPLSSVIVDDTYANAAARTTGGAQGWRYFSGSTTASPAVFWANTATAGENLF